MSLLEFFMNKKIENATIKDNKLDIALVPFSDPFGISFPCSCFMGFIDIYRIS